MYWCPPRGTCIGAYLWVLGYDCMINLQFGYIITVNGHIFHPITEILNLSQKYFQISLNFLDVKIYGKEKIHAVPNLTLGIYFTEFNIDYNGLFPSINGLTSQVDVRKSVSLLS